MRVDLRHKIQFINLHQTDYLAEHFPNITYEDAMGMIHVIDEEKQIFTGFDAIRHLLKVSPLTLPLYFASSTPFIGRRVGNMVYHIIARHRYGINRLFGGGKPINCDAEQCKLS